MPSRPLVSLLMPNKDNERMLDLVLDRLAATTTYPHVELLVIDDGSEDASRQILRRWGASGRFDRFELIEKESSGVQDSLNLALGEAKGEFCVQLDSDASVQTPGWTERMLELFARDERVGLVTGKSVFDTGVVHGCGVDALGPAGLLDRGTMPLEPIGQRTWHYRVRRFPDGARPECDARPAEVDAGLGACMMFRRDDAQALGGFDRGYAPVWMDDVDFGLALRSIGRKVFCLPEITVLHHIRARNAPRPMTARRVGRGLVNRAGRTLPRPLRYELEDRLDFDFDGDHPAAHRARLHGHYAHWRAKWGWDPVNPDLAVIQERWAGTELVWRTDLERRAAGEAILAAR